MMKQKKSLPLIIVLALFLSGLLFYNFGRSIWEPIYLHLRGLRTISGLQREVGPRVEGRLGPYFKKAGINYTSK
ncbi:MAG: hypothetical protein HYU64_17795, partial [Armatimonadetes bacterium]|nr:hypothetical protein [Armatimonadota bacterium]